MKGTPLIRLCAAKDFKPGCQRTKHGSKWENLHLEALLLVDCRRWEEPGAREVPPWNFNPLLAKEHRRRAWAKWVEHLTESRTVLLPASLSLEADVSLPATTKRARHHSFTQPHFVGPLMHISLLLFMMVLCSVRDLHQPSWNPL